VVWLGFQIDGFKRKEDKVYVIMFCAKQTDGASLRNRSAGDGSVAKDPHDQLTQSQEKEEEGEALFLRSFGEHGKGKRENRKEFDKKKFGKKKESRGGGGGSKNARQCVVQVSFCFN
jgi:hypothetical protein